MKKNKKKKLGYLVEENLDMDISLKRQFLNLNLFYFILFIKRISSLQATYGRVFQHGKAFKACLQEHSIGDQGWLVWLSHQRCSNVLVGVWILHDV